MHQRFDCFAAHSESTEYPPNTNAITILRTINLNDMFSRMNAAVTGCARDAAARSRGRNFSFDHGRIAGKENYCIGGGRGEKTETVGVTCEVQMSFRVATTATTTSATNNHAGTSNLTTSAATGDPSATNKAAARHKKINKLCALVTAFFISSYYVEPSPTVRSSSRT
jgi:hypothetical protein